MKINLILGSPGTGKTTTLINIVEKLLQDTEPDKIAFVSFTKKAVGEAVDRAMIKFNLRKKDLKYFKTLHALAYKEVGVTRSEMIKQEDYAELSKLTGIPIVTRKTINFQEDDLNNEDAVYTGNKLLFLEGYARSTLKDLDIVYDEQDKISNVDAYKLRFFADTYRQYKEDSLLFDFTDLIETYISTCAPVDVRYAIIDEAQDLTPLQWKMIWHAFKNVDDLYIAGDDDQAIYKWSGADVNQFLNIKFDKKTVLPKTYRLPVRIYDFAEKISQHINDRYPKKWAPVTKNKGNIYRHVDIEAVFSSNNLSEGSWLFLSRNNCFLQTIERSLRYHGFIYTKNGRSSIDPDDMLALETLAVLLEGNTVTLTQAINLYKKMGMRKTLSKKQKGKFTIKDLGIDIDKPWYDILKGIYYNRRAYYRTVLKNNVSFENTGSITVSTIHGVKGSEADNVVLLSDVTAKVYNNIDSDDEHRVFYVGITRSKKNIHIISPYTPFSYVFPD